jgi:hypothetical protein
MTKAGRPKPAGLFKQKAERWRIKIMRKRYLIVFLFVLSLISVSLAEDQDAIAYWSSNAKVDSSGYFSGSGKYLTEVTAVTNGTTLSSAQIWIGSAQSNATATTISGDITLTTNGTTAIGARKVVAAMLPVATDGQVLIGYSGGSSTLVARAVSGVITLSSNGVTAFDTAGLTTNQDLIIGTGTTSTFAFVDGRLTTVTPK